VVINAIQGVAITPVKMVASGGIGTRYTFSATGLPAGLTMASDGTISGTPTVSGTFPYKATVTDSGGNTGTINCSIPVAPRLTLACAATTTGEVGTPFSATMTASGGTAPYTYAIAGNLPAGLTLNPTTGAVTGTPTASGTFSVKATDAKGATGTACAITITSAGSPSCTLGTAIAYNLIALNGNINDSADITGRIAASGQVVQSTTIGSDLRTSDPFITLASKNGGPYAIVAAGGVPTSNSFNANAGGNVYSSTPTNAGFNFANENYPGSLYAGSKLVTGGSSPVNFSALRGSMSSLSSQLAGLTANGAVCTVNNSGSIVAGNGCPSKPTYFNPRSQHYNPSWLVLYGTNSTTNIFHLTQAQFQSTNNLDIEVPTGSAVIINVAGTSDTLQRDVYFQGRTVTVADSSNILFNFSTATSVTINGQIDAALLAPQAYLSGGSQMGGVFIAKSIGPTGEVHYGPFGSRLPISGSCSQ
jgi:choice-of-anchor A domain-containing protein